MKTLINVTCGNDPIELETIVIGSFLAPNFLGGDTVRYQTMDGKPLRFHKPNWQDTDRYKLE